MPLLNAPGLRDLIRTSLPGMPVLESDIEDVVYLNWHVPAERAAKLLPPSLKLSVQGDRTWLSILTYRHGHFGPRILGPLRKLFPSPAQSNWRLYLEPGEDSVYFVKTVVHSAAMVIGSRLFSDGLPSHYPGAMEHRREGDRIHTRIVSGGGSAPDLEATVRIVETRPAEWDERLRFLVPQNRAISAHPAHGRTLESRIDIPIPLESIVPAEVEKCESRVLSEVVAGCEPFAFVVPRVRFRAIGEGWIRPAP